MPLHPNVFQLNANRDISYLLRGIREASSVYVLTLVFGLECELGFRIRTGHMPAEE